MNSISSKLFGTDGIRGMANCYPMSCDIIQKFAVTVGYLFGHSIKKHRPKVVIAKDTRLSGYMIESALTSGFIAAGVDVMLVGPMPTPAVPFLIKSLRADMGVMISASHNPYHDNGLKLFDPDGCKISDEVQAKIEDMISSCNLSSMFVSHADLGRAERLQDALGRYIEHVKRSFPSSLSLDGVKIVLDCAHGAAYQVAPIIFRELGAQVITMGINPNGININDRCGSMHPDAMCAEVLLNNADIGIALDGDADRVVICDNKGQLVHGDHIIAAIASYLASIDRLPGGNIVVTHMSNYALDIYLQQFSINTIRVPIGDRHVSAMMKDLAANFGAEQSGHIVISSHSSSGDGIVAALQILAMLLQTDNIHSQNTLRPFALNKQFVKTIYYDGINPLDNVNVSKKIDEFIANTKDARILVRHSGTEKGIRIMMEFFSFADMMKMDVLEGIILQNQN